MSLLSELKRRRVFRVAGAYGITAWVITEVSSTVVPALRLPEQLVTIIVVLLIAGFPLAIVLSWLFDFGPDGIERTGEKSATGRTMQLSTRLTLAAAVIVSTVLLGAFFAWRMNTDSPPARDSIAVLPFVNMAGTPSSDYFSDGISEELLNLLANVPGLKVAARTSSFAFKNQDVDIRTIATRLGVATVLEGSVRWSEDGKQVRITAQLIDAVSGYHLWSKTFNSDLNDIFAVQDEIARAIVNNLQVELGSGNSPEVMPEMAPITANVEAFTLYLQGRALWNKRKIDALNRSVDLFNSAIALDPKFARAWSNLAASYVLLPTYSDVSQDEYFQKASEAALAALAIDDRLAESHAVLAHISDQRWQWNDAETSFYFATSLDANDPTAHHWYSIHLLTVGRLQAALKESEIAARLDPGSGVIQANFAVNLDAAGRHDEARVAAGRAVALGFAESVDLLLGDLAARKGDYKTALSLLLKTANAEPNTVTLFERINDTVSNVPVQPEFESETDAFYYAAATNQLDWAYELAHSLSARHKLPMQQLFETGMQSFRKDPRFKQLMRDAGMIEHWRRYGWADYCGDDPVANCG